MTIKQATLAFENHLLEQLSEQQNATDCIRDAVKLLTQAINTLILQVFRKDDYAVKYAVEPLLDSSGPLSHLSVRLKLIYALGIISRNEYEDLEQLCKLNDVLSNKQMICCFTDQAVISTLNLLHCMAGSQALAIIQSSKPQLSTSTTITNMQQQRYRMQLKSATVLCLTDLIFQLSQKTF